MRLALIPLVLLLGACNVPDDDDDSAGVRAGACSAGEVSCVDIDTIQYCEGGEWTEPRACEPLGEPPTQIRTICQEDAGGCGP